MDDVYLRHHVVGDVGEVTAIEDAVRIVFNLAPGYLEREETRNDHGRVEPEVGVRVHEVEELIDFIGAEMGHDHLELRIASEDGFDKTDSADVFRGFFVPAQTGSDTGMQDDEFVMLDEFFINREHAFVIGADRTDVTMKLDPGKTIVIETTF